MGKLKRGGYVFLWWAGDHTPRHVHIYRDGALVVKWDLDHRLVMKGRMTSRIQALIVDLEREGLL